MVSAMAAWIAKKRVGDILLVGTSVAGVETVVAAPELNLCFDVGRAPSEVVPIDTVCITHGHMDHAAGIAYYLSQRGFIGNPPGRIILPRSLAQPVQALMAVWADIEGHHSPGEIIGVEPGQDVRIRRDLIVRPFAVNHGGDALGYAAVQTRHKLKPEYHGLSGPQLVELKRKGVEIERWVEVPLIAYCGDTALGAFLREPSVRDARVLIIECTFFEPEHLSRARAGRHVHVGDLPQLMEQVRCPNVVLIHLSQRTDIRAARRLLVESLAEADLARITFLMERPPRAQQSRRNANHQPAKAGSRKTRSETV